MTTNLNIVLDLDDTLVSNIEGILQPRPYLNLFLKWCFDKFETVSVWTAGTEEWWKICHGNFMKDFSFHKVYTRDYCEVLVTRISDEDPIVLYKPLRKIFDESMYKENTIIIDDEQLNAIEDINNHLMISKFIKNNDNELLKLIGKLEIIAVLHYDIQDISYIDMNLDVPEYKKY